MCMCVKLHQLCPTPCDPMDCSPPGSSLHENSPGKNTGGSCHALPPGDLPNPSLVFPALQADSFPIEPPGKPLNVYIYTHAYCFSMQECTCYSFVLS